MTILDHVPPKPPGARPCFYCGTLVNKKKTWDHLVPRFHGGVDLPANLVICCSACNREKGSLMLDDYRLYKLSVAQVRAIERARSGCAQVVHIPDFRFAGEVQDCR